MRVLEKAGLVQLDDEATGLPQVRVDLAPASAEVAPATGDDAAPPSLPDSTTDPSVVAVAEQRPFAAIYTEQALAASSFPAEKLLKILDGLAALEPASRKAAVLALDAADDAWTIDDALLDAQNKIKALHGAKLQIEDQTRAVLANARAQIEQTEQRQQEAIAAIRKQIADFEALLEREVTRATQQKAELANAAKAAKEACQRQIVRFDAEIARLDRVTQIFAAPADGAAHAS